MNARFVLGYTYIPSPCHHLIVIICSPPTTLYHFVPLANYTYIIHLSSTEPEIFGSATKKTAVEKDYNEYIVYIYIYI